MRKEAEWKALQKKEKKKRKKKFHMTQPLYRFKATPINIPMMFFTEIEQPILKFVCNCKRSPKAKAVLRKNNKAGSILLPDFKLYCKAIIKTV